MEKNENFKNLRDASCKYSYELVLYEFLGKLDQKQKGYQLFITKFWPFSIQIPIYLQIFAHLGPNFEKSQKKMRVYLKSG